MNLLFIMDNVRTLTVKYGLKDLNNLQFCVKYWQEYDKAVLVTDVKTSAESITRAWRKLIEEAKRYEAVRGEREWTRNIIPSNERLEVIKAQENKFKGGFTNASA